MSYELAGLGFSLKPPKAIRKAATAIKKKVTLKNVLKVGAIAAGVAIIPGAAPLLAKTVVGAGKLALGAGKYVGKGLVKAGQSAVRPLTSPPKPAPTLSTIVNKGAATRAARNAALRARLADNAATLARSRLSNAVTTFPLASAAPILTASAEGGGIEVTPGTIASAVEAAIETRVAARTGNSPIAIEQTPAGPVARASTDENAEQAPAAVTTAGFGGGANGLVLAGVALAALLLLRGGKVRRVSR